jgi:hypothetical protein
VAKRGAWRNRLLTLLAVSLFSLLIVAEIMPNPFPPLWDWINRDRPIATDMHWQERLGGRPSGALVVGDAIAVDAGRTARVITWGSARDSAEVRLEWTADWLTTAGTGPDTVVITGEMLSRGYQVRDPGTGTVLVDNDDARAVWGFQQIRMDLRCDTMRSCELRGYRPQDERPLWRADLPGVAASVVGVNPDLATAGVAVPSRMHAAVSGPPPTPPLIGVPVDRRRVAVVSSATGQVVGQYEAASDELVMVVGDRVVRSTATRRDGVCLLAVSGYDLVTDVPVWGPEPYNLRTITGGGCDQRYTAVAAGAALVVVDPEGAERVIDAGDGRVLWRGEPGERVQGLTEHLAVVKAADDPAVRYAVALGDGGGRLWERRVDADAEVMLTRCGVVVVDRDPNRVHVWNPADGEDRLTVRTSARVLACTADGLILADGRAVGRVTFDGVFPEPAGGSGTRDDGTGDGTGDGGIGRDDKDDGGTRTGPGPDGGSGPDGGPGPGVGPGQVGDLR